MNRPLQVPSTVHIELTNRCNAKCPFCWFHGDQTRFSRYSDEARYPELSDERWLQLTEEICDMGTDDVTIASGGGEPFVRGNLLIQMLERLTRAGIRGAVITNGTLLTGTYSRRIVELGWGSVQISLHGPTAELHDEHLGLRGGFGQVMKSVNNLLRWKSTLRSDLPEIAFRIVLTGKNYSTLPTFIRLAKSRGISKVHVRKIIEVVSNLDQGFLIPDETDFGMVLLEAKQVAEEIGVELEFEFDVEQYLPIRIRQHDEGPPAASPLIDDDTYCSAPFNEFVIFANGMVAPCANYYSWQFKKDKDMRGILENASVDSLTTIWRDGFSRLRSDLAQGEDIPCRRCTLDMKLHTKSARPGETR